MLGGGSDTARKGLITHLAVTQKLVEKGYEVLQPFSDLYYDLTYISTEDRFIRVQCKSARLSKDGSCLLFNTSSLPGGRGVPKSYRGEVEYFGIYSSDTGKVYLVPVDVVPPIGAGCLRIEKTKNNQDKKVNWAKDYEL